MLDKNRSRAYRQIMGGLRYHSDETLSFLTVGFRRGYEPDIRRVVKQLMTRIKRGRGHETDYFMAIVRDGQPSKQMQIDEPLPVVNDIRWRTHFHMIRNAPYVKQAHLVEWLEKYNGDNVTVRINMINNEHTRAARYLLQYLGNQNGDVTYCKSKNWLPQGHRAIWEACKRQSVENTAISLNPYNLALPFNPVSLFENWIDEQKVKNHD